VVTVCSLTDSREIRRLVRAGVGLPLPAANFDDHLTRLNGTRPCIVALRQHSVI